MLGPPGARLHDMPPPAGRHRRRSATAVAGAAVAAGLAVGAATALAQGRLPSELAPLATSSGAWCLVAFVLALPAPSVLSGGVAGAGALAGMLTGYGLTDLLRGYPSSSGLLVLWAGAALLAGPLLGVGAHWLPRAPGTRAALGVSILAGVLLGEAGYGLTVLATTSDPRYWWGQAGLGALALLAAAVVRLRGVGVIVQSVLFTAAVATTFPVIAMHAGALMLLAP
ncbi:hypothetical protein SAMN05660874_03475 [Saccharopolyspora flava]|uniref:Uncharacterized protein n=2 Tax=Saccharopolyspora flava TaxID=95161 RepID=A0A1I6SVV6_9PSEU|nr:hypothetical protein SAMN05660874_03475 [Saccharopolyspora flava]